jgi:hypothetical protein
MMINGSNVTTPSDQPPSPPPSSPTESDLIGLEPLATAHLRPTFPGGGIVLRATPDEVYDAACADLLIQANNCVRTFGDFHLAVTATAAAEPFLARLMWDPQMRDLPWKRTHLWISDTEHEIHGSESIKGLLVEHSDLPLEQFHPLPPSYPGDESTLAMYEATLRETLGWRERGHDRLDHVILSLDPASPLVRPVLASPPGTLIMQAPHGLGSMMTMDLLNAARFLAVIGVGQKAARELSDQWRATPPVERKTPSGEMPLGLRLRPHAGELRWYLDAASME